MTTKKASVITNAFDLIFVSLLTAVLFRINVVSSQLLNSPPIPHITERNWRIFENEKVGQVIARIRAEDAEGDELHFGLEPRFSNKGAFSNESYLPFTIDKDSGIVYLNESLQGRAGENILLYVTVSDGRLSAKIEVFVNILSNPQRNGSKIQRPPLIPNVQDILPSFESLPGVQSIRNNGQFNYRPSSTLFTVPAIEMNNFGNNNHFINVPTISTTSQPLQSNKSINIIDNVGFTMNNNSLPVNRSVIESNSNDLNWSDSNSIKTTIMLGIFSLGIFCIVAVLIVAIIYRKKLFKYKQNLSESSKAQLAKMSNQRVALGNICDDRNSMVLQNWNGPQAYGNRYVPWERDQSIQHSEIPSVSAVENTVLNCETTTILTHSKNLDSWEYPRHRLKFFNILGEGAFGQVWKCEATDIIEKEDVTTVAVKTLKENATEVEKKDLLSELEVGEVLI